MLTMILALALVLGAGGLSRDAIQRVVQHHHNEIKFCYQQGLQKHPGLAGKVKLHFTVGPDGRVLEVTARDVTLDDEGAVQCMTSRVRAWTFPKPEGGGDVEVAYPFEFQAAEETTPPEEPPAPATRESAPPADVEADDGVAARLKAE